MGRKKLGLKSQDGCVSLCPCAPCCCSCTSTPSTPLAAMPQAISIEDDVELAALNLGMIASCELC